MCFLPVGKHETAGTDLWCLICFMLMLALHMLYSKHRKAGLKMAAGALLFVLSDTVLAVNKFYYPFMEAGIIIMATYGVAQLLIVQGAIEYTRKIKSK
ncbi:MAG: lysoplasmalogenase family protein [Bacteroidota bacterium]